MKYELHYDGKLHKFDSKREYNRFVNELNMKLIGSERIFKKYQLETKVVNRYHGVPYDVYIGRGSKWGNPYTHLDSDLAVFKVDTREEAVEKYREWILNNPSLLEDLHELKGKVLGCFCKPSSCHGDILVELVNELLDD